MRTFLIQIFTIGFAVALGHGTSRAQKFRSDQLAQWDIGSYINPSPNETVKFHFNFIAPTKPGSYDVIFFLTGFDGFAPEYIYSDFAEKLVLETNTILISMDAMRFVSLPDKEARLFDVTFNWAIENLQSFFTSKNTPEIIRNHVFPRVSPDGFTLMSHSSAAHPIVSYLNKTCGQVKKLILMNPVDGYDPFGFIKIFITNPPKQLPFTTPTLVIAAGLDSVPVLGKIACAPTNLSDTRFYKSLPGPTWYMNFTNYGHADILDDWTRSFIRFMCKTCHETCDYPLYLKNVVRAISYFIKGVNEKNATLLNKLSHPGSSFDVDFVATYKSNGFDITKSGPFCQHQKNFN